MPVAPSAKDAARTFEVDGVPVKSFFVTLLPSPNGPAHLTTVDAGTHEFSRVHFSDGHFQFGQGNDKIGPCSILRGTCTDRGIHLYAHDGRVMHIQPTAYASATFTPAF